MLKPAFKKNNIPIVFASDDNYSKYLCVLIKSIVDRSTIGNNYDFIILETSISKLNKFLIQSLKFLRPNVSIRFLNLSEKVNELSFFLSRYFTNEAYYRLFIPTILKNYDKALYLDIDMLVLKDIKELYDTDVEDYLLGAALNLSTYESFARNLNLFGAKFKDYCIDVLKLEKPENYFNSGLLVMNLKKMREQDIAQKCIDKVNSNYEFIMHDQDILNSVCQGQVKIISQEWNMYDAFNPKYAPKEIQEDFSRAFECPKLVHYAGCQDYKVWFNKNIKYARKWWKCAGTTLAYPIIFYKYMDRNFPNFKKLKRKMYITMTIIRAEFL